MKDRKPVEYLVSEDGKRTGVVLRWEDYEALKASAQHDPDLIVGLSEAELRALVSSRLASNSQDRLGELLEKNRQGRLSVEEARELDELIEYIDQMNILKARAALTLQRLQEEKGSYE
jgi:hypothetical protein